MNTIDLKSDLHNLIDKINDTHVLNALKTILSKQVEDADWWDELPDSVRESILEGLGQSEAGNTIEHEIVMREVKEKYGSKHEG